MFNFINKVNTILNLFHKSIYEMFFARVKMTTINTHFIKNAELIGLKSTKIYRINRKRRLLEKGESSLLCLYKIYYLFE